MLKNHVITLKDTESTKTGLKPIKNMYIAHHLKASRHFKRAQYVLYPPQHCFISRITRVSVIRWPATHHPATITPATTTPATTTPPQPPPTQPPPPQPPPILLTAQWAVCVSPDVRSVSPSSSHSYLCL